MNFQFSKLSTVLVFFIGTCLTSASSAIGIASTTASGEVTSPGTVTGPGGRPIQLYQLRPGSTPGTVTGPDGYPIYIILPSGDGTAMVDVTTTPLPNIHSAKRH